MSMSSTPSISPPTKKMQERPGSAVTGQGLARNPSFRSRPIRKTPLRSNISGESGAPEDDAMAANAQVIADLKQQVERAELASENYRRQLDAMQKQLDESSNLTMAAEEREFQFRTQIDTLQAQLKDSVRQNRELELSYDSERKLMVQDKERQITKEAELHSVVNRLKENLRFKNQELASTSKTDTAQDSSQPDDDYLQVLQAKDNAIEALRLELADIHLGIAEQQHMGDGRWQTVEKELVDIKMKNARLQEENESFQMLLSERTIKGDFMHEQSTDVKQASSLAEELESADEEKEVSTDAFRSMESENKKLRESNKALTLYIDKIIDRILQHEGFEHIIKDEPVEPKATANTFINTNINKALPEPPAAMASPRKVSAPASTEQQNQQPASMSASLLQRARSVVARPAATPRTRPVSMMPSTANENPETAPRIPINRGHRRARSDQANDLGAATVIQQMNRGSQLRTTSGGPMSPGLSPMSSISTQRQSYFPASTRSGTTPIQRPDSSSNSMVSEHSLEGAESTDAASNSARASVTSSAAPAVPGAVMKQNQLRPLRLVQNQVQSEEEQKKANRGSWMGWFNRGNAETQHDQH